MLGPHRFREVNDAGKELLSFLLCHQAAVCNTWFEKKNTSKLGNTQNLRNGTALTLLL